MTGRIEGQTQLLGGNKKDRVERRAKQELSAG